MHLYVCTRVAERALIIITSRALIRADVIAVIITCNVIIRT